MLVAHAPVGYLVGSSVRIRGAVAASIAGALAPDVDVLPSFVLAVHHHAWPTHWPVAWALVGAGLAPLLVTPKTRPAAVLALLFVGNALLHLVCDSLVGDVRWLAPWSQHAFAVVHLKRVLDPWWLNFVLHPSFLVELALVAAAAYRYGSRPASRTWVSSASIRAAQSAGSPDSHSTPA